MVKVKICGITNLKDAEAALRCGADALGFIFAESPRGVSPAAARSIAAKLGPFATLVGVFVNERRDRMLDIAAGCRLDALQLHGDETPDTCASLRGFRVIKTVRMGPAFSPRAASAYPADALLLETDAAVRGGSGKTWDWSALRPRSLKLPFIVGGGLTPSNVGLAVRTLRPYAVDVASGVERRPGTKDHTLLERFIRNAKKNA